MVTEWHIEKESWVEGACQHSREDLPGRYIVPRALIAMAEEPPDCDVDGQLAEARICLDCIIEAAAR